MTAQHAVERRHPPDALMKLVNPVVRRLRLGIRITVGHTPTVEELEDAVTRSGLSLVRLDLG